MQDIEQRVRQQIEGILSQQCGAVKREQIIAQLEGLNVIYAITSLVADIEKEKQILIQQLQEENRRLNAKLNQLSFCNDSERDKRVFELYKKGLPKTEIAKQTGLSRPGLYKTLRRLGVHGLQERDHPLKHRAISHTQYHSRKILELIQSGKHMKVIQKELKFRWMYVDSIANFKLRQFSSR